MRDFMEYGKTLTVGELRHLIKDYPPELPVIIEGSHGSGPAVGVDHIPAEETGGMVKRLVVPEHIEIRRYRE